MCIGINIISACCCWHIYTASLIKVLTAHTPYSVGCILNRLVYSLAWKETRSSPHPVFLLRNYENGWKLCGSLQDEKVKITVELRWAERATGYSQVMSWHEFLLFFLPPFPFPSALPPRRSSPVTPLWYDIEEKRDEPCFPLWARPDHQPKERIFHDQRPEFTLLLLSTSFVLARLSLSLLALIQLQ